MNKRFITFYEPKAFLKDARKTIGDEGRQRLKSFLAFNPEAGALIPGSGGVRKLRWSRPGTGKRGGARVIYYFYREDVPLYMFAIYAKSAKEDLTQDEIKEMRKRAEAIRKAYSKGGKDDA